MRRDLLDEEFRLGGVRKGAQSVTYSDRLMNHRYIQQTQSKSPQAIMKVIGHGRGTAARRMMMYIAGADRNYEKTGGLEDQDGTVLQSKREIEERYQEWREDFERKKPGKRAPRHCSHIILSADCEHSPQNERKLMAAARDLMQEEFGQKGYRYVMSPHNDGARPHVHIVLNAYNRDRDKPKVRIGPTELFKMRSMFADRLRDLGIEQVATRRLDRPQTLEKIANRIERVKPINNHYQWKVSKSHPDRNVVREKQVQSRAIREINQQIKDNTVPLSGDRKRLKEQLKQARATLKSDQRLSSRQIESTVKALGKDAKHFERQIGMLQEPKRFESQQEKRNRRAHERYIRHLDRKTQSEIQQARKEIQKSDMGRSEKQEALRALRNHQRQMDRVMSKQRTQEQGRGR